MQSTLYQVEPGEIQDRLNEIWESLETTNTTRACLFNLILYTKKTHRTGYIQKLAQAVIEKFPARVIFITVDPKNEETLLKTQVSILSSSKGDYDVACDFIQIDGSKNSQVRIPFVVLPLILSDLPVYLVLAEDPSEADPLAEQLKNFADRLIFDSESAEDLTAFASSALKLSEKSPTDIADLNWARIESWREMLSTAFYSQDICENLKKINRLDLFYNSHSSAFFCHTKIQALYLQAWLGTRLQWEFQKITIDKESSLIQYTKEKKPIEVRILPLSYEDLPPGLILTMDLTTSTDTHFKFERDLKLIHQITLNISTSDRCELPCKYIFAKAESGHSLVKEICHRGTSKHFLNTLKLIEHMHAEHLC